MCHPEVGKTAVRQNLHPLVVAKSGTIILTREQ
jgi:hypothetical protein